VENDQSQSLRAGDPVNLEADLIAKYVEKMMNGMERKVRLPLKNSCSKGFRRNRLARSLPMGTARYA